VRRLTSVLISARLPVIASTLVSLAPLEGMVGINVVQQDDPAV
jgi:hypothetical protein